MFEDMLLIICLLASFLPVSVLFFYKLKKYKNSSNALFLILVFEIILITFLWQTLLTNITSAAAIIFPGILAIFFGICLIIGILFCPIFFFLCSKPEKWKKKILWIFLVYLTLLLIIFSQAILTKIGLNNTIDLYGKVTNRDGSPVNNAIINFSNCYYINENPSVTDENGLFNVKASCRSYFSVLKIYNPNTNSYCQNRFKRQPGSDKELITFDGFHMKDHPEQRPHWVNYGKESPFVFSCIWELPKNLLKKRGYFRIEEGDGKYLINLNANKVNDLIGKKGEIEIEYNSRKKHYTIKAVNGSVKKSKWKAYIDTAPMNGYKNQIIYSFNNSKYDKLSFFFKNNKNQYGHIALDQNMRNKKIRFRIKFLFNPDGGTNLISHETNYESIH